jgi:hypothetical protein
MKYKKKLLTGSEIGLTLQLLKTGIGAAQENWSEYKRNNSLNIAVDSNPYARGGKELVSNNFFPYEGPKHEEGGIDIAQDGKLNGSDFEVEGGETRYRDFVYSDYLKDPQDTSKTFAEQSKKIMSKYKKSDTDSSQESALDFELGYLKKRNKIVKDLLKGETKNIDSFMMYGDSLYEKNRNPPLASAENTVDDFVKNKLFTNFKIKGSDSAPITGPKVKDLDFVPKMPKYSPLDNLSEDLQFTPPPLQNVNLGDDDFERVKVEKENKFKNAFSKGLDYTKRHSPDYIQSINTGIQALESALIESPILPDYSRTREYMDEGNIDFTEGRNSLSRMANTARSNVRNSVRSNSVAQALTANTDANAMNQMSDLVSKEGIARSQQALSKGQMEAGMVGTEAQALYQNRVDNLQNMAATRNMKNNAVSTYMQDRNTVMQRNNEKELALIQNNMYKNVLEIIAPDFSSQHPDLFNDLISSKTDKERAANLSKILSSSLVDKTPSEKKQQELKKEKEEKMEREKKERNKKNRGYI